MIQTIYRWLITWGINELLAVRLARYGSIVLIALLSIIAFYIARHLLLLLVERVVNHSKTSWDDYLLKRRFFSRIAYLAPAAVLYIFAPYALEGVLFESWQTIINYFIGLYVILLLVLIIDSLISALLDICRNYEFFKELPLTSFFQALKIGLYLLGVILFVSVLLGQSPLYLFSGLGAVAAVLSFVYQDALRGFVAGIQLTANKMVSRGDWIEMPSYDVNGTVSEVGLTTVKIRNFDYSITTVPTYALISSSFKNWRHMLESDGRRVVRALYIDMSSIRFCDAALLDKLRQIHHLTDYITTMEQEINTYNHEMGIDDASLANGRRLTNVGLFREYIAIYLRHHPAVNTRLALSVHQLEPTVDGLPIQLLFYTTEKTDKYMPVQSDIFDHLLSVVSEFDLRLFQHLSGQHLQTFMSTPHDSEMENNQE
ncbi:MAG: mechanosensitive ion channel [Anaerolineales bacterium]|nr:mechanosensitive ion channel [Anaerolineales bacterium]